MQAEETITGYKKSWTITEPKEHAYSSDDVINAYIKGTQEGLQHAQRALIAILDKNVERTSKLSAEILTYIHNNGFKAISAFLKIESWDSFSVLITIEEDDFLNDSFLKIYSYVSEIENKNNNDLYSLSFIFTDYNEDFDQKHINADGFILKHKETAIF